MSTAAPPEVGRALEHCRDVTRRRARNFYYGLKLLPEPQRSAMYAIYAWMRRADDLVDDTSQNAEAVHDRLESFRAATAAALRQAPPENDPLWTALAFAAERFNLTSAHFGGMLDGQLDDVADRTYETFEELREYCYRVASTVGLVCIEVWGYSDPGARNMAVDRGIAFQLTNILRDFRQDLEGGRVYLPHEDLRRHGLTAEELLNWTRPSVCVAFVTEQARRAESFYDRSAPLDQLITPTCRPTLWAMTEIYHGLLRKILDDPSSISSAKRLRLSSMQKGLIALRARWLHSTANGRPGA